MWLKQYKISVYIGLCIIIIPYSDFFGVLLFVIFMVDSGVMKISTHVPHSAHKVWETITSSSIEVRIKAQEIAAEGVLDPKGHKV